MLKREGIFLNTFVVVFRLSCSRSYLHNSQETEGTSRDSCSVLGHPASTRDSHVGCLFLVITPSEGSTVSCVSRKQLARLRTDIRPFGQAHVRLGEKGFQEPVECLVGAGSKEFLPQAVRLDIG